MGLSFRGSNVGWAYSGFNRFRARLAKEIGLDLDLMEGFGGDRKWSCQDAIIPFLNHSDCEGELTAEECATVGPRLKELVKNWDECVDKSRALELANDMILLGSEGNPLIFT